MDPHQRILLEVGLDALVRSGRADRDGLVGSDLGVYVGFTSTNEWPTLLLSKQSGMEKVGGFYLGMDSAAAAGRLSYILGLKGPSLVTNTACSSSLVAVYWGAHAVERGECCDGLTLGVSLKLVPHGTLGAASAGMLSVDGRCKTLDARANGYARSEGVGALVVRRGDDEGTLLCGSAVRQDGRSASLTAPNGSAQRTLLLCALGHGALGVSEIGGLRRGGAISNRQGLLRQQVLAAGIGEELELEGFGSFCCLVFCNGMGERERT